MKNFRIEITVLIIIAISLFVFSGALAADKENCLMCHKYPSMARVTEDGLVRDYYVDEHIFLNSLHGDVGCRDCHTYIKKFPHDPVTEKVNCANECHIRPPFSDQNFSHQKIIDVFNASSHGIKKDDPPLKKDSKPDCKYCHLNPLFKRVDEATISYGKTLDRCLNCHQQQGVSQAYRHMLHRLRHKTSRSNREIVSLCAKNCHGNPDLMKKLGASETAITAVETYNESIHGKMTTLGSERAADCISCHASSLIHDIYDRDHSNSAIKEENLLGICKNCHSKVDKYFIKIAVHPSIKEPHNPILFTISNLVLRFMMYGTILGLMGLLFLETYRRKKDGMKMTLTNGSSWRNQHNDKRKKTSDQKEPK